DPLHRTSRPRRDRGARHPHRRLPRSTAGLALLDLRRSRRARAPSRGGGVMATSERFDSVVVGTVRSVNDRGLKLDGYDSWFNVSRFAVGVVLPERGETVAC